VAKIKSFPNNQDEYIGAEDVMRWLHGRTSGVFGAAGNAAVAPVVDSMAVTVSDGCGWLANDNADGIVWWNNSERENGNKLQLSVDMADGVLARIDRVVVSWDTTNYVALPDIMIVKGIPASSPVAPALTNNNLKRQISLAQIRIPAGSTAITSTMITDERLNASVCGLVTAGIGVDTTMMEAQFAEAQEKFLVYMEAQQAAWEAFFQNVQDDTLFPVPTANDAGKVLAVNESCDGYTIKEDNQVIHTIIGTEWEGSAAPYTLAINIDGILETDTPHITPAYSGDLESKLAQKEAWEKISDAEAWDDVIVFTCFEDKPQTAIPIQIEVNR
jgi:hypothetical protein